MTWARPHNPEEVGTQVLPRAQGAGLALLGPSVAAGPHRARLTWSRYPGSTSARTFSVLLLISEGFRTTQLPVGRGGERAHLHWVLTHLQVRSPPRSPSR